jgi:shikimate kinase
MGAGKSTIGRLLAKTLEIQFLDSDKEIERKTGVTIPMIFEYEGESGFRKREMEVIDLLSRQPEIILATGGGAVLLEANRQCLMDRGFVVYLHCPIEKQLERTHKDTNRPLLQTVDPKQRLKDLFEEREPIYRALADVVVDTGQSSSRSVVRQILKAHEKAHSNPLRSKS